MIPTVPTAPAPHSSTDDGTQFFLDDAFNTSTDGDWWLDLGLVDLPQSCAV